jgi:hypothetical protein
MLDLSAEELDPQVDGDEIVVYGVPAHFRIFADHSWLNIRQKSVMMFSTRARLMGCSTGLIRLPSSLRTLELSLSRMSSKKTKSPGVPEILSSSQSDSSPEKVESVSNAAVGPLEAEGLEF